MVCTVNFKFLSHFNYFHYPFCGFSTDFIFFLQFWVNLLKPSGIFFIFFPLALSFSLKLISFLFSFLFPQTQDPVNFDYPFRNHDIFIIFIFSIVQIWVLRVTNFFFLQFLVNILPLGSGS